MDAINSFRSFDSIQPGTNAANAYHSNPTIRSKRESLGSGRNGSMGMGTMSSGSTSYGATGTGPGNTTDCTNPSATSNGTRK